MYIGLDLGTSGVKGILISEDQKVLAEASAPLTVSRPHEGWSEQSPPTGSPQPSRSWTSSAPSGLGGVRAIGLSGQMHGATLLDANDEGAAALHPVERHAQLSRKRPSSTAIRSSAV